MKEGLLIIFCFAVLASGFLTQFYFLIYHIYILMRGDKFFIKRINNEKRKTKGELRSDKFYENKLKEQYKHNIVSFGYLFLIVMIFFILFFQFYCKDPYFTKVIVTYSFLALFVVVSQAIIYVKFKKFTEKSK